MSAAPALLGRGRELEWIEAVLRPGRAGLLLGPKGIGKTTLVRAACDLATDRGFRVAWTSRPGDLAAAFSDLGSSLHLKDSPRACRALLSRILVSLRGEPPALVLVDEADLACRGFLRALRRVSLDTEASLLVAARTGPHESTDALRRQVLAGSSELHLRPLPRAAGLAVVRRELPVARAGLADEIWRASGGIPAAVTELARRRADPRYRVGGRVSLAVILADLRLENQV